MVVPFPETFPHRDRCAGSAQPMEAIFRSQEKARGKRQYAARQEIPDNPPISETTFFVAAWPAAYLSSCGSLQFDNVRASCRRRRGRRQPDAERHANDHRLPAPRPHHPDRMDHACRRHAARRDDLAAGGCRRAIRCRRSSNICPIAGATARCCATARCTPISPATAMPACASTCAAPAIPTACSPTNTCRRSRPTPSR